MGKPSTNDEARVVMERNPICDERHGPGEYGRIGFAIGSRVFWTESYAFPGSTNADCQEAQAFAEAVVNRWNAGREALSKAKEGKE